MKTRSIVALSLSLASLSFISTPASAAQKPDLAVSVSAPGGVHVYDNARYTVSVDNIGTKSASGVTLTIQLPETSTSPTVYVMGTVGARDPRCTLSGTALSCALGTLLKGAGTSVYVDLVLPYAAEPLAIDVHASTTTPGETNLLNNDASHSPTLLTFATPVVPVVSAHTRHCTGQNLTSFFECELFPSSITAFDSTLNADQSVTLIDAPEGYSGEWNLTAPDHLRMDLYDGPDLAASFDGWGVGGGCFEGLTTFPDSTWISMYEVCLQ